MTDAYSQRFDRAMSLTLSAFRPVRRKCSGAPYITHLLAVTALVGEHGGDEDQLIAALLHDYLEDIPSGSEQQLREVFGDRVAELVVKLSDTVVQPKPPWRERKLRYIEHLRDEHSDVKLISAADKLHNCTTTLRDLHQRGPSIFECFKPTPQQTLWYYREVYRALKSGWEHPILLELNHVIGLLHETLGEPYCGSSR